MKEFVIVARLFQSLVFIHSIALAGKHLACFSLLSSTIIFPPSSPLVHEHVMPDSTRNILRFLSRITIRDVMYRMF